MSTVLADAPLASAISFNEALIRLCLVHDRTVEFRYAKGDGTVIETRRVTPATLTESKGEYLVFSGFDPDRDAPRAYRVGRILGDVHVV